MPGSMRKKMIAIALAAALACSCSVSVFAVTNDEGETANHINALPLADEATVEENEPTEDAESERQTELNEQEEHTEDEIVIKEEPVMPLAAAAAVNSPASVPPRAGEVAIDATNFPDPNFRDFVKQYDTDNNGSFSDAEIASVTKIECIYEGVESAQGIEYFTALTELRINGDLKSKLREIDVSNNTRLKF